VKKYQAERKGCANKSICVSLAAPTKQQRIGQSRGAEKEEVQVRALKAGPRRRGYLPAQAWGVVKPSA
jgi:hypothetical protein